MSIFLNLSLGEKGPLMITMFTAPGIGDEKSEGQSIRRERRMKGRNKQKLSRPSSPQHMLHGGSEIMHKTFQMAEKREG